MSDELAKMSLKELIAHGKLGQLNLKRRKGKLPCQYGDVDLEKPKEAEIFGDKEEMAREKEAERKLIEQERLRDKEERKKLFQEQRARKKEERIELEKEESLIKRMKKSRNQSPKSLRIKPLTPQEQLECEHLMRLYDNDIGKVAMKLWVSPIAVQTYWLNKSKEIKAK
jgi:hypothetical protein